MMIGPNEVIGDLNVGITTIVEFSQKKGHAIGANPNTKITDEQYDLPVKEFSIDKDFKLKTERFIQERQSKDRNKASVSTDGCDKETQEEPRTEEVMETVVPEDIRPKFKPVGKIDLDKLSRKYTVGKEKEIEPEKPAVEEIKAEEPAPVVKAPKSEPVSVPKPQPEPTLAPVVEPAPVVEEEPVPVTTEPISAPKEEPVPVETEEVVLEDKEETFKIHQPEFVSKINVIGQIDLAVLNQSTRPKKKSKEEKRKEHEEKKKQRQDQKKLMKETIIKEIRRDDNKTKDSKDGNDTNTKRKRVRISKEKVDVNNVSNFQRGGNDRSKGGSQQGGNNQQPGKNKNKDRSKKPVIEQEISEEDVAKQVKETLARLTSRGKNKGTKYCEEKCDMVFNRMQKLEDQEVMESEVLRLTESVTANELTSMMDVSVTQVTATCMSIDVMVSTNQYLDAETINLVAEEPDSKTEYISAEVAQAIVEEEDAEEDLEHRAPIVTVMGHVDHGKTSLLDYTRKVNVTTGEAGGITQYIGACHATLEDGRKITFLDTPGHEVFTAMHVRGIKATGIAITIVATDDNVMSQTKEAINYAMVVGVLIVFAISKIDKPTTNPDKTKEELVATNFLVEGRGGKYQSQDIFAEKGTGASDLMEKVLLEAKISDSKANPNCRATGSIIESSLDKGCGYVATVSASNGTSKMGDIVLAGIGYGKVRAMFNERSQRMKEVGPSEPALILGLNGAPAAGDTSYVIETEQEVREITNKHKQLQREQGLRTQRMLMLDKVGRRLALGDFRELNIIVKGNVDGLVEALSDSLIKLSTEQVQMNVIHKGVGTTSEPDVFLVAALGVIIIGFQARPLSAAIKLAKQEGVDIRKYSAIYSAIEEVKVAMEGMLAPTLKRQATATIKVREVFDITKVGLVAGAMAKIGKVKRSGEARLVRDGIVIFTGNINALKRFKDDVKEVGTNFECGISLMNYNDIRIEDIIESYEEAEVKQTLQEKIGRQRDKVIT